MQKVKFSKVVFSALLIASLLASMLDGVVICPGTIDPSDATISVSGNEREEWLDNRWHYRMFITVDSTGHDRRKGDPIEYKLGLDNITDLDVNSIRLLHSGVEIPSEYDADTDTLVWTLDDTIHSGNSRQYTVYYDTNANGLKEVPDYGTEWFTNATDPIIDMWQNYNDSHQAYIENYQIKNVSGVYELRGEPVYESGGKWYYLNGTEAKYYIVGDGEFYWYNGSIAYRDDQGNWYFNTTYFNDPSTGTQDPITGSLYFDEGRYSIYLPGRGIQEIYHDEFGWYYDVVVGEPGYNEQRINIITADVVHSYYSLWYPPYDLVIYRDSILNTWYYTNNSMIEGYYDEVNREFYFNGHRVFESPLYSGDWSYYNNDGDLVSFASQTTEMYYYKDKMVYKNETGYWIYMDGTEVVGSILDNNGTWYLYVGDDLEAVYLDNKTLVHDGELIYYNSTEGKWYYNNGTEYTGSIDDTQNVYIYNGNIVYEVGGVWYYENGTTMVGYVYDDAGRYYLYHDGILAYFYEDPVTGIIYYWNGTTTHQYGPFGYDGQDFYLGSSFTNEFLDAFMVGNNLWIDNYKIGNVKAVLSGKASITSGGTSHEESSSVIMYRGSKQFTVKLMNNAPEHKSAWGSVLFNLNGSIKSGGNRYTVDNYTIFLDQIKDDFGVDIQSWIEDRIDGIDIDLSGANRYIFLAEDTVLNIDDIDWATQGVVVANSSFNRWNSKNYHNGDSLTVAPIRLNTRYLGVYDIVDQVGVALGFNNTTPFTNILVEVIKEVDNGGIKYFLNASLNYLEWWYDHYGEAAMEDILHAFNDGNIDVVWTYLDNGMDPVEVLENIVHIHGAMTTDELNRDPAIPINITIHSPVAGTKVKTGSDLIINVTVSGETLSEAMYKVNVDGTVMNFDQWNSVVVGIGNKQHKGKAGQAKKFMENVGNVEIYIVAFDTNGSAVLARAPIIIEGHLVSEVVWTIVVGSAGFILALLGLAILKNRKLGKSRGDGVDCIGGECNI
jgi:hypothetical protein